VNVAQKISQALLVDGVATVFTIPGSSCLSLLEAMARDQIRVELAGNEPGVVHAAHGYAAAADAPYGCALLSRGPGGLNGAVGIATACDGFPVLTIIGDNEVKWRGRDLVNQDLPLAQALAPVCDVYELIEPRHTDTTLARIQISLVKERRSCVLIVPSDIASARICEPDGAGSVELDDDDSIELRTLVRHAKRPFVISGRNLPESELIGEALRKLSVQRPRIPIAITMRGLSRIPEGTWGVVGTMGDPELNRILLACDLLIVLDEDLRAESLGRWDNLSAAAKIVSVGTRRQRYVSPTLEILGGESELLATLKILTVDSNSSGDMHAHLSSTPNATEDLISAVVNKMDARTITLDAGKNFFLAAGSVSKIPLKTVVYSDTQGTMGFALPAAIGAAIATNEATLAVLGDGGLIMTMSELPTINRLRLPVTILLIDDRELGMVRDTQRSKGLGLNSTEVAPVDFRALSTATGLDYVQIRDIADLNELSFDHPSILHVVVESPPLRSRGSVSGYLPT